MLYLNPDLQNDDINSKKNPKTNRKNENEMQLAVTEFQSYKLGCLGLSATPLTVWSEEVRQQRSWRRNHHQRAHKAQLPLH